MERFENKLCPICRSPFNAKAEIVVCPICGTPHHRACYMIKNRCAYEDKHASGYVWNGHLPDELVPEGEPEKTEETTNRNDAGIPNNIPPLFGEVMSENPNMIGGQDGENIFMSFLSGMQSQEIGEDGVSIHELTAYAGSSIWHYGRAFSLFRGTVDGKKHFVSFNLFSGLLAPTFQFYRKMDLIGVVVLIIMLLPMLLTRFAVGSTGIGSGGELNAVPIALFNFISTAAVVLLCLFGDYIYYRHAVKQIKKVRRNYKGDTLSDDYFLTLCQKGNPSFMRAALGCLALIFAEVCIIVL